MPEGHLEAIEAVKQVKYAYFRLLDLKRFDELGELLTPGCTAAYEDGRRSLDGREAIVAFLTEALGDPAIVSEHHGHHPEIEIREGGATATGVWYLQDRVVIPAADLEIGGTAFYRDEYEVSGGRWLIAHTGYERVFEEHRVRSTMALRSFRSRF
ncbi:MAG: nuclear transport factor 2 family protein [Acidimicrobiales bacterium]